MDKEIRRFNLSPSLDRYYDWITFQAGSAYLPGEYLITISRASYNNTFKSAEFKDGYYNESLALLKLAKIAGYFDLFLRGHVLDALCRSQTKKAISAQNSTIIQWNDVNQLALRNEMNETKQLIVPIFILFVREDPPIHLQSFDELKGALKARFIDIYTGWEPL